MNPSVNIAMVGAGSHVFCTGLLHDLLVAHRLEGCRVVMMDPDGPVAETMAALARRVAGEVGVAAEIVATIDRAAALAGADFVTLSAAVQLLDRYRMDREVLHRHGITEIHSECGGVGGLSYALRQVPLVLGVARDMEHHSWERPGDVIAAMVAGRRERLDMINRPNRGAVADLSDDGIVEVHADVLGAFA